MIYNTPEVTKEDDFLFDLRGYLLLPSALPERLVSELNDGIDAVPPLEPQQWFGHVHRNDYSESWGYNLQNIVEGGPAFEAAMDCPGFLPWVRRYAGHDGAPNACPLSSRDLPSSGPTPSKFKSQSISSQCAPQSLTRATHFPLRAVHR